MPNVRLWLMIIDEWLTFWNYTVEWIGEVRITWNVIRWLKFICMGIAFFGSWSAADPGIHLYGGRNGATAPSLALARGRGEYEGDVPPSFVEEKFWNWCINGSIWCILFAKNTFFWVKILRRAPAPSAPVSAPDGYKSGEMSLPSWTDWHDSSQFRPLTGRGNLDFSLAGGYTLEWKHLRKNVMKWATRITH